MGSHPARPNLERVIKGFYCPVFRAASRLSSDCRAQPLPFNGKNLPFWINWYSNSPRLDGIEQEMKREKRTDRGGRNSFHVISFLNSCSDGSVEPNDIIFLSFRLPHSRGFELWSCGAVFEPQTSFFSHPLFFFHFLFY